MKLHLFEIDSTSEYFVTHLGYIDTVVGDSWKELLTKFIDSFPGQTHDGLYNPCDPFIGGIFKVDSQASMTHENLKALGNLVLKGNYSEEEAKALVMNFNTETRVAILEDENNAHLLKILLDY